MENATNRATKTQILTPVLLGLAVVGGMLFGSRMDNNQPAIKILPEQEIGEDVKSVTGNGRVEEIIRYIDAKYVDDVESDALVKEAITNVLKQLDPHSSYIPAKELKEINEQLDGNFDGIGIEYMILDDTIIVVTPLSGGPSEAAGLIAGDKIVRIEDSIVAGNGINNSKIADKLRGAAGTDVKVSVLRKDGEKDFTITRDKIPNHSVDVSLMLEDKIGLIKVNRFSATTYEEFMKGVEDLNGKGMEDLIIDLRYNPGGYLGEATQMLSQLFQEKGQLLVYTEGDHVSRSDYETSGKPFFKIDKIAVLIDEGSASASEILAGAIQDHDRGWIIGRRSFGKGLVQEQYNLKDGSALRLTIARYYTPSGRCIQKNYEDRSEYDTDVFKRYETGELLSQDSIVVKDSMEYFTDLGRRVYAGGGITPEIFVPLDTITMNNDYIRMRQYIPQFIFRYVDKYRDQLGEVEFNDFLKEFKVKGDFWNQYLAYCKEKGEKFEAKSDVQKKVKTELELYLKARLAKLVYGDLEMYSILNKSDEMVKEAVKVIKSDREIIDAEH